jgi:hypothetical protein
MSELVDLQVPHPGNGRRGVRGPTTSELHQSVYHFGTLTRAPLLTNLDCLDQIVIRQIRQDL